MFTVHCHEEVLRSITPGVSLVLKKLSDSDLRLRLDWPLAIITIKYSTITIIALDSRYSTITITALDIRNTPSNQPTVGD